MKPQMTRILGGFLQIFIAVICVCAQQPADDRYRIGPGDVLDIRIYNRPQL
jgi:protein involved in polysaccharide export with SLBB domain